MAMIEFVGSSSGSSEAGIVKEEGEQQDWKRLENSTHLPEYKEAGMENSLSFTSGVHDVSMSMEGTWTPESLRTSGTGHVLHFGNVMGDQEEEGFTNLLLNNSDDRSLSDGGEDSDNGGGSGSGSDYYEDNKNYWNSILNLVNSPPSDSPMF